MILRRLMAHVKDQNGFAVGLDFAIVAFGVFIGIQRTQLSRPGGGCAGAPAPIAVRLDRFGAVSAG